MIIPKPMILELINAAYDPQSPKIALDDFNSIYRCNERSLRASKEIFRYMLSEEFGKTDGLTIEEIRQANAKWGMCWSADMLYKIYDLIEGKFHR